MSLAILLSVILFFPHVGMADQETPAEMLPQSGEVQDWTKHRPLQRFAGEDLYEYIDGGAEIYHEYGFVQVVVQDYTGGDGKSVSVEIFEMTSPAAAYGIYTFKTSAKGKRIPLGNDAQLADYYMNFWKGPYLVTLTGFDESEETRQGLWDVASNVSSKIPPGGEMPPMVSLLPVEDLADHSVKYFTGYLGLRNSHPFFSLNVMGYEEGVKGDYSGGFSLFLIRFKDEEGSQGAYQSIKGQEDRRGRRLFATVQGRYLMFVLGETDHERAYQVFVKVRKNILD